MTHLFYLTKNGFPLAQSFLYYSYQEADEHLAKIQVEDNKDANIECISVEDLLGNITKLKFIEQYLLSSKFMSDVMVNKQDILLRLHD